MAESKTPKALNKQLLKAVSKNELDEVQRLIESGADIESQAGFFYLRQTPLGIASFNGNLDVVKYLLDKGANVNVLDSARATPLYNAVRYSKSVDIVRLLMQRGADPNIEDREGYSALMYARKKKKQYLVRIMEEKVVMPPKPQEKAPEALNPDEVIFQRPLGDRILQESFDFVALERVSLVRKSAQGAVEAMSRDGFSVIEDQSTLRKAFEEHVRRGGKTEESRVFPNTIFKDRPSGRG